MTEVKTQIAQVKLLINGQMRESRSEHVLDLLNPANQELIAQVPLSTEEEMNEAVESAKRAFKLWKEVSVSERCRVFLRLQHLLREHMEELALCITKEQGKTLEDARGDVFRGLEVVEQAANLAPLLMGESLEGIAKGIDCFSLQQPLGVCAGITPFNFPAMVPLWMFPIAIAAGNTFVLKPSEQDPMTIMKIADLLHEAGLPRGVLNIIHGTKDAVNFICDHPDIRAVSFVGSEKVGHHVYARASANGKRVQALLGAKNHLVIMPDANKEQALNALVGSAFGAAGQRCMAVSVAVFVGRSEEWINDLLEKAKALKVGAGHKKGVDFGPLISPEAKERVEGLIGRAVDEGAEILLDGRNYHVEAYETGNFVGPTILSNVDTDSEIYRTEVFGPVLCIKTVASLEGAIELCNRNRQGNGTAIFTSSGSVARKFQHEIDAGMVGINVPIPVPLPFFSFTGAKDSIRGDLHAYGKHGVRFYTQTKTVTSRWFEADENYQMNTTIKLGND